jgi:hypothetical protein
LQLGREALAARFAEGRTVGDAALAELVERWRKGDLPAAEAGDALLRLLGRQSSGGAPKTCV